MRNWSNSRVVKRDVRYDKEQVLKKRRSGEG